MLRVRCGVNMTRSIYLFFLGLALFTLGGSRLRSSPADDARVGIEKLHQLDLDATLAHDPQALADLFSDDAVLLEPEAAPLVGKPAILAANKRWLNIRAQKFSAINRRS